MTRWFKRRPTKRAQIYALVPLVLGLIKGEWPAIIAGLVLTLGLEVMERCE